MVVLVAAWCLLGLCPPPAAAEHRCGWLENPTPANWWLNDADGLWVLSTQGGTQPSGMDLLPDISEYEFVPTNGHYGYSCACLDGEFDANQKQVTRIVSVEQLPLLKCRKDPKLSKPSG
jgi:hypothetical protein